MPAESFPTDISSDQNRPNDGLLKRALTGKTGYFMAVLFSVLFTAFAGYRAQRGYA